ncbi:hypothetical protein STRCI_001656 [Streptomyces cinnabarinus]|uniref:Uncharacterized protein n=1 Tax=Streptomyces cinnabarinus TaxID=67287 RepID=A0ABY7K7Q9_9ACTN|nr:hypothetical protein [Streptomyces cinnabarinus]WAZ20533.1 hypothetical protein STRCI_001656 [Streptomyces cinnabarinus]
MTWLPADSFVTFCKGLDVTAVAGYFTGAGRPPAATGESSGWVWAAHDAYATPAEHGAWERARDLTRADGAESVFLASTPACACPHGQNYMVPHCPEHPFQFVHSRGGFEGTLFNLGRRRESRRGGGMPDLLVRELLDARIVGRDTSRYDADPDFNADGAHTLSIIAAHYALPTTGLRP